MVANPLDPHPSPPPSVSVTTIPITGLWVDVYGLSELDVSGATSVACLWLHHPRGRRREDMGDFARAVISAFYSSASSSSSGSPAGDDKGLIALAFDQRNHGSRLVDDKANGAWREGNPRHAQDMFGVISGGVSDSERLIDAVGGYLFHDDGKGRRIEQHLVLGVSLGGHGVWQAMFADQRIGAGVAVIGCPDFEYLMTDRARLSKLATHSAAHEGRSFIGSKDFPPALVEATGKLDPKAILFGVGGVVPAPGTTSEAEKKRLRTILDARIKGKKFLVCSGGEDKLVPYRCSQPFMDWFKDAARTWYADGNVYVEDNVYPGIGHAFSEEMVRDAIRFVIDVVRGEDGDRRSGSGEGEAKTSKI